jgi:hypothetical protein
MLVGMVTLRSRGRLLAAAAGAALVLSTLAGCAAHNSPSPPAPTPTRSLPTTCPGQYCYHADDFGCIIGGCHPLIRRMGDPGPEVWVDYVIEDIDISAPRGNPLPELSGRIDFAPGATSATLAIVTIPDRLAAASGRFRVVLSVDGVRVAEAVGTIGGH